MASSSRRAADRAAESASATPAWAHRLHYPKQATLTGTRDRVVVAIRFDVEPGEESSELRVRCDRNANFPLDGTEVVAIETVLARAATHGLSDVSIGRTEREGRFLVVRGIDLKPDDRFRAGEIPYGARTTNAPARYGDVAGAGR